MRSSIHALAAVVLPENRSLISSLSVSTASVARRTAPDGTEGANAMVSASGNGWPLGTLSSPPAMRGTTPAGSVSSTGRARRMAPFAPRSALTAKAPPFALMPTPPARTKPGSNHRLARTRPSVLRPSRWVRGAGGSSRSPCASTTTVRAPSARTRRRSKRSDALPPWPSGKPSSCTVSPAASASSRARSARSSTRLSPAPAAGAATTQERRNSRFFMIVASGGEAATIADRDGGFHRPFDEIRPRAEVAVASLRPHWRTKRCRAGPGTGPRLPSVPRRIRHERVRERLRLVRALRLADHALGDEIAVAVVPDRDRFGGAARGAHEVGGVDMRVLAFAVAGAEAFLACALRGRRGLGGRTGTAGEAAVGSAVGAALGFGRRRARRFGLRLLARDLVVRAVIRHALGEHRDADHADVRGPAGLRSVAVGQCGEVELRDLVEVLAPACDLGRFPRIEHVAGLVRVRGLATDRVDAVDAEHREHAPAAAVGQPHRVAMARRAGHVELAVPAVGRQGGTGVAIDHGEVEQVAGTG